MPKLILAKINFSLFHQGSNPYHANYQLNA